MKPNTETTTSSKKPKVQVPNTEKSQALAQKNRKYLLIMGGIIALIVLLGGYLIYRLANQFIYQSNLNKAQDQLLSALSKKENNLELLKPNFAKVTAKDSSGVSDATRILQALPLDTDYENLIAILERMGQESGVKVTSVSQSGGVSTAGSGAPASTTSPTEFPFTVNLEGSYNGILDFLKKTEESARVINFSTMNLSGGGGIASGNGNITANITMITNYQPQANIQSTFRPLK